MLSCNKFRLEPNQLNRTVYRCTFLWSLVGMGTGLIACVIGVNGLYLQGPDGFFSSER